MLVRKTACAILCLLFNYSIFCDLYICVLLWKITASAQSCNVWCFYGTTGIACTKEPPIKLCMINNINNNMHLCNTAACQVNSIHTYSIHDMITHITTRNDVKNSRNLIANTGSAGSFMFFMYFSMIRQNSAKCSTNTIAASTQSTSTASLIRYRSLRNHCVAKTTAPAITDRLAVAAVIWYKTSHCFLMQNSSLFMLMHKMHRFTAPKIYFIMLFI